jgi:hypothetical protein
MRKALFISMLILVLLISAFFLFRAWLRQGELSVNKITRFQGRDEIVIHAGRVHEPVKVYIDTDEDLFSALGIAQSLISGDRMVFFRICTEGRLSEYFGSDYKRIDEYLKSWQFRKLADETHASLDAQTRLILNAFTEGINERFERIPPPSGCLINRIDKERWTPEDILAVWHFHRWSQLENWPLTFFVRYAEIYYGKQVKEQFETAIDTKISPFENPGRIRDFEEIYHVDRELRNISGLKMLLKEHADAEGRMFGYGSVQNDDWLEIIIVKDSIDTPVLVQAGLPVVYANPERTVVPYKREYVPLSGYVTDTTQSGATLTIRPKISENTDVSFYIPTDLFDVSGDVFSMLVSGDSLEAHRLEAYSYALHILPPEQREPPFNVKGVTERELENELYRIMDRQTIPVFTERFSERKSWGMLTARLMDEVYRDDLGVIHAVFTDWPGTFPDFFLGHLVMMMKNPYSAWWDNRKTPEKTENKNDVIPTVIREIQSRRESGEIFVIPELREYPLSRYHPLAGTYRYSPKELKTPLVLRYENDRFTYDRFTYIPSFYRFSENSPR